MDNTFIINKTGEKVAEAIDKALKIDEKLQIQKTVIDQEIQRVESIAKGRVHGIVFDTEEDMFEWVSNSSNTKDISIGCLFLIRETDVPDYWWDGESAQISETSKVDLTEYAKKSNSLSGYGIIDAYTKKQADEKFQDKLSEEQLKNISDVTNKQNQLSEEQIKNINDVQNKVPKEQGKGLSTNDYSDEEKQEVDGIKNKAEISYVKNAFANALKGTTSGQIVAITDISPIEHNVDVKVRSKNILSPSPGKDTINYNDATNGSTTVIGGNITLIKGKTYTMTFDTEDTRTAENPKGTRLAFTPRNYTTDKTNLTDKYPTYANGSRQVITFTMTEDRSNGSMTLIQRSYGETGNTGLCSNAMIEEGKVATEYAPYVSDVSIGCLAEYDENDGLINEYPISADGTVEGVTSKYPYMKLRTLGQAGVVADITYNRDINKAFADIEQRVKNLENAVLSLGGNV